MGNYEKEYNNNIRYYVKEEYQHRYDYRDAVSICVASDSNIQEISKIFSKSGELETFEVEWSE